MQGRRGRPVRGGMRQWLNDEAYMSKVTSIMRSRDRSNEETLTEVTHSLEALARETLPEAAQTIRRFQILRRLALRARPALVWRILLGWRLGLEDRIIRHILKRKDLKAIAEIRWA